MTRWAANLARETKLSINKVVNKVTWQQVGHVTEPGRYMFRFGWLTIAAEDLAVWNQFPNAAFALVRMTPAADEDEFRLGAFDVGGEDLSPRGH